MDHPIVQVLPSSGPRRAALRERGQFWTPDWVADAMITWCAGQSDHVFDPSVGAGSFFRAAKRLARKRGKALDLFGAEIDLDQMAIGCELGLSLSDYEQVAVTDFMHLEFDRRYSAIVGNPPYVRHHRFSAAYKAALRTLARRVTGEELDGRAGLHVFFLIKALTLLEDGGRLAFIVPADVCEGRFASKLWTWIERHFCVEGAVTFSPEASPFPGVDTNPIILFIRNSRPSESIWWARVNRPDTAELQEWCDGGLGPWSSAALEVVERKTDEAIRTGLSRRKPTDDHHGSVVLGDLFKVMRGVATGDNQFFFMDRSQMVARDLPSGAFVRAIGRTGDHAGPFLTREDLDRLDARGRPTYLLSLGREPINTLPHPLQEYLEIGKAKGLPNRPLIMQRSPWYRMEQRIPPTWLFSYLGRRKCRFIRNSAGAIPLTGFLCVYPRAELSLDLEAATNALNDERTIANLVFVAKSYGAGALKVEPRNLERLPIPQAVLNEYGLAKFATGRLI